MAQQEREGRANRVTSYLDRNGVDYELVEHAERFTAAAEARASGIEPDDAAKDVVLHYGESYMLAVIPASQRLDLHKIRALLGGESDIRLATEPELGAAFSGFELGALPPFGPILGAAEIIDRRLLEHERVLCSAGDHRHSLKIDPRDMVRLAGATVADICED